MRGVGEPAVLPWVEGPHGARRTVRTACASVVNQRSWVLLLHSTHWSDRNGEFHLTKDMVKLPSNEWVWLGNWTIDKSGDVDNEGWAYALTWQGLSQPREGGHRCAASSSFSPPASRPSSHVCGACSRGCAPQEEPVHGRCASAALGAHACACCHARGLRCSQPDAGLEPQDRGAGAREQQACGASVPPAGPHRRLREPRELSPPSDGGGGDAHQRWRHRIQTHHPRPRRPRARIVVHRRKQRIHSCRGCGGEGGVGCGCGCWRWRWCKHSCGHCQAPGIAASRVFEQAKPKHSAGEYPCAQFTRTCVVSVCLCVSVCVCLSG